MSGLECRLCHAPAVEDDPLHDVFGTALLCRDHLELARDPAFVDDARRAFRVSFRFGPHDDRDLSERWRKPDA